MYVVVMQFVLQSNNLIYTLGGKHLLQVQSQLLASLVHLLYMSLCTSCPCLCSTDTKLTKDCQVNNHPKRTNMFTIIKYAQKIYSLFREILAMLGFKRNYGIHLSFNLLTAGYEQMFKGTMFPNERKALSAIYVTTAPTKGAG